MYKNCKTKESAGRQKIIADTFLEMLKSQSYHDISISELCRQANVPRKTFYRYFDSKEDIFSYICDSTTIAYELFDKSENPKTSQQLLEKVFRFWLTQKNFLYLTKKNQLDHYLAQSIAASNDRLKMAFSKSTFHDNPELASMANLFMCTGLFSLIFAWRDSHFEKTPAEMADILTNLLTKPLYITITE